MNKNLGWKLGIIVGAVLIFVYGVFGIPSGFSGGALADALLKPSPLRNGIHLGLDLKGGTHLILQVEVNDAVNFETDNAVETLKAALTKVNYGAITKPDPTNHPEQIVIKGVPPASLSQVEETAQSKLPEYDLTTGADGSLALSLKPTSLNQLKDGAVDQAIDTIRGRIDELGVSEPVLERHGLGQYQILLQLPGIDDPVRVKALLQNTAVLEIKLVLDGPFSSQQEALQKNNGVLPDDSTLLPGNEVTRSGEGGEEWYLVTRSSVITGRDMRQQGASVGQDQNAGQPDVIFSLTNDGGRKFADFTGAHVGERLAVVLNHRVREAANIQEQIHDQVSIHGGFTEQTAKDLVFVLNSGALPAAITYLEERTVGPSLGQESISAGVRAAVIGMAAVLIFMLIYYRAAGINADIALILNLIILLGCLGYIGAALTLPGIAGVILTVGMGVDSNVLIFERIREELRNGKTPPSAVDQGFGHAWITIVDTHVTTIVSAAILFWFGTGPVKGFATTLVIGLFANLFTAVFVSRTIFDWVLGRKAVGEALSI